MDEAASPAFHLSNDLIRPHDVYRIRIVDEGSGKHVRLIDDEKRQLPEKPRFNLSQQPPRGVRAAPSEAVRFTSQRVRVPKRKIPGRAEKHNPASTSHGPMHLAEHSNGIDRVFQSKRGDGSIETSA